MKSKSTVEDALVGQIADDGLPAPSREVKLVDGRRFQGDLVWVDREPQLLVEVEGGTYSGGRHVRPLGYEADCEKYNLVALQGRHLLLRVTSRMVKDGRALDFVRRGIERTQLRGAA